MPGWSKRCEEELAASSWCFEILVLGGWGLVFETREEERRRLEDESPATQSQRRHVLNKAVLSILNSQVSSADSLRWKRHWHSLAWRHRGEVFPNQDLIVVQKRTLSLLKRDDRHVVRGPAFSLRGHCSGVQSDE